MENDSSIIGLREMKTVRGIRVTLEAARVNRGLTKEEAARQLGVDLDLLEDWECHPDNVEVRYQKIISHVYQIPIDILFFGNI